MNQPKINPYMMLAIGVIAVSTSAIFVKLANGPAAVIAFYRMLFSVALMAPIFLLKHRNELLIISKKDWMYSIIAGVFLAFHFILWFESLNYTSVTSSTVLVTMQPIFAFIGAYFFFKEKIAMGAVLSTLLALGGSVIISWGDFRVSGSALYGDFLAIISCMMVTAYLLFGQTVRKRVSLVTYTFVVYGISAITLFIYVLALNYPLFSYASSDWMYFLLLAIVPNLLGHNLFNWSLEWVSTSVISVAILFEPVGAAILAYFILSEKVIWTQILGGVIIIIGIGLYSVGERRRSKNVQLSEQNVS
ncbi:DMT family transporter [Ferdinandcohnia quinoae]|uniref:DMT family transporter n=1 Tax=Fredinandcohnia quinoae TaxID=2918902 RepID=A0AAW5E4C8_9BACI|nr:DMT family transporter [Fredinandcohnia sp. SECRCQ15]MCH1627797.1 DMT family transporter [Fredinandcohnia sp. SECRCQ15]